jgi:hypothetical protein
MVQIVERKLIQHSGALCISINQDWLKRFRLHKGDTVDLLLMKDAILIVDRTTDFNADNIKAELDLAQKIWIEKEDREMIRWFNKLSVEEQAKVRKNWEEFKLEKGEGEIIHWDSPYWNKKPREPCDPETLKLWAELHPNLVTKPDKEWLKKLKPAEIADLRKFWTEMLAATKDIEVQEKGDKNHDKSTTNTKT